MKCTLSIFIEGGDLKLHIFEKEEKKLAIIIQALECGYKLLEELLPGAKIIRMSNNDICWEGHRWGLGYVHFEDSFYRRTAQVIEEYVGK